MPDRPTEWYMRIVLSRRVTDLLATSMPLAGQGSLGAATVTGTALLPPLVPGHLCGVGLSFFGSWAEVSFVTDRALPLGDSLPGLWELAVGELERAVDGAALPPAVTTAPRVPAQEGESAGHVRSPHR